jgi:hypothetical protein
MIPTPPAPMTDFQIGYLVGVIAGCAATLLFVLLLGWAMSVMS